MVFKFLLCAFVLVGTVPLVRPADMRANYIAVDRIAEPVELVEEYPIVDDAVLDEWRAEQEAKRLEEEAKAAEASKVRQTYVSYPSSGLTPQSGVNYYGGRRETYYSSTVLYHYRTPEWWLDNEGFYHTSDGYYVVAASDMPQNTVFECSKGNCIVLDTGCAAGTTDYYVKW